MFSAELNRLFKEIDSLLVANPVGDFLEIFDTFSPLDNESVRNLDCWLAPSMDMTGVGAYGVDAADVEMPAFRTAGTLISPRHAVVAEHSSYRAGQKLTWITKDGIRYQRTILDRSGAIVLGAATTDIEIVYLGLPGKDGLDDAIDSNLPSSIKNYKIFPKNFQNYTSFLKTNTVLGSSLVTGKDKLMPIIIFNQHNQVEIHEIRGTSFFTVPETSQSQIFHLYNDEFDYNMYGHRSEYDTHELHGGDSSHPAFVLYEGEPVLMGCHYQASAFPFLTQYTDEINAAMASLEAGNGGTDGYQLQVMFSATHTENGRRSMIGVLPSPDRIIDTGDRRQLLGLYRFELDEEKPIPKATFAQIHQPGSVIGSVHQPGSAVGVIDA